MYTTHHPCWDAKNRYSLPEQMDMSFDGIAHLFTNTKPKAKEPDYRAKLRDYLKGKTQEQKTEIINKYGINANTTNEQYKAIFTELTGGN
jgi:hypothetical protein